MCTIYSLGNMALLGLGIHLKSLLVASEAAFFLTKKCRAKYT